MLSAHTNRTGFTGHIISKENAGEHQLFPHSIHSWQVDKINEPPVELLPVRKSILTKAGFIVATWSVECESKMKLRVKRGLRMAALSFLSTAFCLPFSPPICGAQFAGPHNVPPGLSSSVWSQGPRPNPALACALHTSTHPAQYTHAHTAP